ncbi:MAG: hypothetical protein A2315_14675 [Ignavibacteria bacterium RIFOXYB2_FULL_35_12]|nr:MAG: hypothetical protein A2058_12255 [Ignavibacteria bacterium GWA2_36_19]OGU49379.1 MAG: hypothetical protein A2006_06230 [Ignavibacteria bacterium GWC2_35_8]OGU59034.1 MAG: hypothetical protein A2X60_15790 [Ignavibacteria bacterium GWF2_35_20]OGU82368.1 MAG: hypothetical protein A2254_03035 [Ignavibacteria bacterium RIFOXYA2_FULL_35_9]OGU88142.1 MAG: hypothetical protein A2492_05920 [Ignavibacteria bacterium RIFOXYC12_FULL_35_11]OGU89902.1 MAG: hypothetical protein A3K31_14995 [Ignavibac
MSWEYNFLDHTADIAVDIKADTLDELFMASAYSWRDYISDDDNSFSSEKHLLDLSENNLEVLLVSFLSELNFLYQSESWMMDKVNSLIITEKNDSWNLNAEILGQSFNRKEMNLKTEIKAITYHQMEIKEQQGRFSTRIVFDI